QRRLDAARRRPARRQRPTDALPLSRTLRPDNAGASRNGIRGAPFRYGQAMSCLLAFRPTDSFVSDVHVLPAPSAAQFTLWRGWLCTSHVSTVCSSPRTYDHSVLSVVETRKLASSATFSSHETIAIARSVPAAESAMYQMPSCTVEPETPAAHR